MTGGLLLFGCAVACLATAIGADALVAWAIRKWRASVWSDRK